MIAPIHFFFFFFFFFFCDVHFRVTYSFPCLPSRTEAWGNLGSLRFAKDVASFVCEDPSDNGCSQPFQSSLAFQDIKMDNIVDIVDVRQVGASTTGRLWAHDNGLAGSDELAETVEGLSSAANNPQGIPVLRAPGSNGLPPSSAAAFLECKCGWMDGWMDCCLCCYLNNLTVFFPPHD